MKTCAHTTKEFSARLSRKSEEQSDCTVQARLQKQRSALVFYILDTYYQPYAKMAAFKFASLIFKLTSLTLLLRHKL